jgi:predicted methyltransferase
VVQDEIEADADAALMGFVEEGLKIFISAEKRVDLVIIAHVIPVIVHRGIENRADPKEVHPEIFEVIKPGGDAGEVPHPVIVGVLKRFWVNDVADRVAPPMSFVNHISYYLI